MQTSVKPCFGVLERLEIRKLIVDSSQKNWCLEVCYSSVAHETQLDVFVLCVFSSFVCLETIFTLVTLVKPSERKMVFGSVLPGRELICYVASVTGFASSHPRFPAQSNVYMLPAHAYLCWQQIHTEWRIPHEVHCMVILDIFAHIFDVQKMYYIRELMHICT